ncbi:MAG: T9SS type A sorting domain-containing protein [Chitinophagales bacterium]|nr:T9SS type A sorting domain-containing protein [Chitinophagales bacterium]
MITFLLITLSSNLFSQEVTKKVTYSELKDEVIRKLYSTDGPYARFKPENEIVSKRDLHSKHFLNPDGTISAVIGAGNIHYIENGLYKTIVSNLENSDNIDYGFMNRYNSFKTYYGAKSNEGINIVFGKNTSVITNKNLQIEYFSADYQKLRDPLNISNVSGGLKDESGIVYKNVLNDIDMEADQNSIGFKTSYVLNSLSSLGLSDDVAYIGFSEDINLPEGWKIKYDDKLGHAALLFVDKSGELMIRMEPPLYFEKEGKSKISGNYTYIQNGRNVKITYYIQKEWLTNSNRKFPVVIDPTTVVLSQNTTSSWWTGEVDEDSNCGASGGGDFRVGFDDGTTSNDYYNAWSRFDMTSIPDDACISSATIEVYQTSFKNSKGNDNDLKFYVGNLSPLSTDPIPASCGTIYDAINAGGFYQRWDVWGTCSGSCSDYNETANAWKTLYSGTAANTDITNSLAQNFYVVGLDLTESHGDPIFVDNDEWLVFRGTNNANRPKLTVVYYQNNTAATGITVGSSTICNGGSTSLTVSGGSLVDGTWTWYAGGCGSGTAIGTGTSISVSPGSTTTYYVRAENPCRVTTCASTTITVRPLFTPGAIQSTGEIICYGGDPGVIGNTTLSSGGDNSITYEWRANGTPIGTSNSSTYDPPAGLTATTTYTRWAKDATCNTTFTQSIGNWIVTVRSEFTAGAINTTGETICYGGDPANIGSATAASGGDNSITYKWQANGVDIPSSNSATYNPPAGLTTTTTYTRWAKDATCNTTFTQSTGSWTVYVSGDNGVNNSVIANTTSTYTCNVNDALWHYFRNSSGEIIAAINSNGQNLGNVTMTVTIANDVHDVTYDSPEHGNGGLGHEGYCFDMPELSMRRWYEITPTNQPSAGNPSTIRLFFTNADYVNYTAEMVAWQALHLGQSYGFCYGTTSSVSDLVVSKDESSDLSPNTVSVSGGPSSSTQYELQVPSFSTFRFHTDGGIGGPLPVELLSFTGTNMGDYNKLEWITASEINSKEFVIEKSTDITNWTNIGVITAAGFSSEELNYSFIDNAPNVGNNYYRLKIINTDGTFEYSKVINLPIADYTGIINVYPNPTSHNINVVVSSKSNQSATLEIFDVIGKQMVFETKSLNSGLNTMSYDVTQFAKGAYIIKVIDSNGKTYQHKFVKD